MNGIDLPGGPDAVLLVHGLRGNPLELQQLGRRLNQAGYAVRVPFIHGYGERADERSRVTPCEAWVERVASHLQAMSMRYRRVALGGLCIGANVCLRVAASHSHHVAGLLLISTTLFFDGWNVPARRLRLPLGYLPPLRQWIQVRETEPFGVKNERLREWIRAQMRQSNVSVAGAASLPLTAIYQAQRLIRSVKRSLPRVTAPALILHALDDDVASPRSASHVAARIGSRVVVKRLFANSYHMLTLDNEKVEVGDAALEFLSQVVSSTRARDHGGVPAPAEMAIADR